MSKKKKSFNHYASTPYTQIPDGFWVCKRYNRLSAQARCIFTVAISKWNPYQPDEPFPMPYRELRRITHFQLNTVGKSLKELIVDGFLEASIDGGYPRNTTMYKLNHELFSEVYPRTNKEWLDKDGSMATSIQ